MKIAVFSDTHFDDPRVGISMLSSLVQQYTPDAELVLHAGDLVHPDILLAFPDRQVHAVQGNMDPPTGGLPVRKVISAGHFRIGLIHGWGPPEGMVQRLAETFRDESPDAVVFGHTHEPLCDWVGNTLFFNPGSCTRPRRGAVPSFGMIEIGRELSGRIIPFD